MRPTITVLEKNLIEQIIDQAFIVLEKSGVHIEDEHALKKLEKIGLTSDKETNRVTFPRKVVEKAISDAPSSITLYDRDGTEVTKLEGDQCPFCSSFLRFADFGS